jgi:tetratricopeptide (TPR) repeat protein
MRLLRLLLLLFLVGSALATVGEPNPMDLLKSGSVDEAIRILNSQAMANPDNAQTYGKLCRVYNSFGDYDSAIQNCQRAIRLQPDVSEFHLWLGRAYGDKADRSGIFGGMSLAKKTVAEFERAVQLAPNDVQARIDLTEFYREAPGLVGGGSNKAHKIVEDTASIDPVAAAFMRAQFALKDKDFPAAEAEARSAVQQSGGSSHYLLELARIYGKQKHWKDFESTIIRAVEATNKRPVDVFDAADMLVGFGRNLNGAVDLLHEYLKGPMDELGPAFRAHFLIGRAYEKMGKKAEAAQEYRSALDLAKGFKSAQDALKRVTS